MIATEFGNYSVLGRLGRGGSADVYLARIEGTGGFAKKVALKILHQDLAESPEFKERFLNEARLLGRLDHPHIARVHDVGVAHDRLYMALDYVDGPSLGALLQALKARQLSCPPTIAVRIVSAVLEALHFAHEAKGDDGASLGLVHRDVTPENVLLSMSGEIKLCDFGIARSALSAVRTRVGIPLGQRAYMAPEQLAGGTVDRRADIFATATLMRTLLAGATLPPALARAIERGRALVADERYTSAAEFADALARATPHAASARALAELIAAAGAEPELVEAEPFDALPTVMVQAPAATPPKKQPARRTWLLPLGAIPLVLGAVCLRLLFPAVTPPAPPVVVTVAATLPASLPSPASTPVVPVPAKEKRSAFGYLTVNSRPWSRVWIDGKEMKATPVERQPLAPGTHKVLLVRATDGRRVSFNVEVVAHETTTKFFQWD